jgi:hypothetical protein
MGVVLDRTDKLLVAVTTPFVLGRFALMAKAVSTPSVHRFADANALRVLRKCLATYGVDEAMTESHGHIAH